MRRSENGTSLLCLLVSPVFVMSRVTARQASSKVITALCPQARARGNPFTCDQASDAA